MALLSAPRRAGTGQAGAIAALMRAVWPDEGADERRVAAALAEPTRLTLVAEAAGLVVGLVDCFETRPAGGCRWEVDLLAVHPRYRGRGIAARLVAAASAAGVERGATVARGLVALDNVASQRTFARCGYRSDGLAYGLYLSSGPPASVGEGQSVALPVVTLRYRGLWVEQWTAEQFVAAQRARLERGWDVAGAVLPESDLTASRAACAAGFARAGRYGWWLR